MFVKDLDYQGLNLGLDFYLNFHGVILHFLTDLSFH